MALNRMFSACTRGGRPAGRMGQKVVILGSILLCVINLTKKRPIDTRGAQKTKPVHTQKQNEKK